MTNSLFSDRTSINPNVGINKNKDKLSYGVYLGTAITNIKYKSDYLNVKNEISKKYFFPSIESYLNITISKKLSLYFNYDFETQFPLADQILSVTNSADALNTFTGNPDLDPEKKHSLYFNFNRYDFQTQSGFFIYTGMNFSENNIVSSTTFDSSLKRNTTYANVSNTFTSYFGFSLSKTIKKGKNSFKYRTGISMNLSKDKGFSDAQLFEANKISFSPNISFTYSLGEILTVNPSYNFTYTENSFKNYLIDKTTNVTHNINLETTSYFPKHFVVGSDFGYNFNSNIADGFKKDFYLWNVSLGYNFFKDKLLAKVKVYDALNQNQSNKTSFSPTNITDELNTVLKRYVMFSLTYKIQKFGGKEKPSGIEFFK